MRNFIFILFFLVFANVVNADFNQYGHMGTTLHDYETGQPLDVGGNLVTVNVNLAAIEALLTTANIKLYAMPYNTTITTAATWKQIDVTDVSADKVIINKFPGAGRIAFNNATSNYQTISGLGQELIYPTVTAVTTIEIYADTNTGNASLSVITN